MKLRSLTLAAATYLVMLSCDEQKIVKPAELPAEVTSYITTHFPGTNIAQASTERDGLGKNYDITLTDGTHVEFNGKSEVTDLRSTKALPLAVVPAKIQQYVTVNYPGSYITGWESDGNMQQAKLDNGIKLEFDKAGGFKRIDQ